MTEREAKELINGGIEGGRPELWMDLGCGNGTFTAALATMLPQKSRIIAVDKKMQLLSKEMGNQVTIEFLLADFELESLDIFHLDGILLANSLHYIKDKASLIHRLEKCFEKNKKFLIVEYDTLTANPWVPYPIDFKSLNTFFSELGYNSVSKLGERPSLYGNGNLYAAIATNKSGNPA
ncbi:trans-aconitate methyltransferase [Dyadobacter sp. BE34]|uniref:Trans-aconitate methyltransferase n=1 Tax=Dyadobacter fermentans TaxID=94254 RepID=A0ABU1QXR1_9BACT|nr:MULTISPECIES: class I SAM-dependent methyltransferase [Dyadobacter]MDR6805947.1 trans-aconitate methyltransferase [Dyadobacter fermentans]MDR7043687.1 trans-aconitate methyltransferase [Dyadobacter sp. BE242]MDR7197999.1 trans-aconitate methyltransferase [Dyadobacter sp. BE34]MDR7215961.1 trans-aconitate methyltransferase [Dyadobacter sp. BE31]MDR7264513.1 trans-aconitate methyltransferase [Dyadobacter sp. BE32]